MQGASYLGRLVAHLPVLQMLGSTPRSAVLPSVALCPLCSEDKLHLFLDANLAGTWGHCRSCGFAGSMVDLAAACWKLDAEATVRRLSEHGLFTEKVNSNFFETHAKFYVDRPRDLAALWAKVHIPTRLVPSGEIRALLRKLSLQVDWLPGRWRSGLGQLVGVAECKEIERTLHPDQKNPDQGNRRIFTGRTVDAEALFVPFEDLPGRISALAIAWLRDNREEERLFVRTLCPRHNQIENTGLAFLSTALEAQKDRIYVLDNVWTALRLQAMLLQEGNKPLPILACSSDPRNPTCLSNQLLSSYGREVVFWSEKLNKNVLRLAYQTGGLVASNDGITDDIITHLGRYRPVKWLKRLDNLAVPWDKALATYLTQVNDLEMEGTLLYLGMGHAAREVFCQGCPSDLRARLLKRNSNQGRSVSVGGRTIFEKDDAWYSAKGELICGAVLRIDSIITLPKSGEAYYRGRIVHGGKAYPFIENTSVLENSPFSWMRKQLLQHGVFLCHKPVFPDALNVAIQFHPPISEAGREGCGWDNASGCFVAENFSISARGEVLEGRLIPLLDRLGPTQPLKPPRELQREDIAALSRRDDALPLVWATTACVLASIVAPVLNRPTSGIAYTSPSGFRIGSGIGRSLGCAEYRQTMNDPTVACRAAHYEQSYGWPIIVLRHPKQAPSILRHWLASAGPRNCLVELNPATALAVSLENGWNIISAKRDLTSTAFYTEAAAKIAPAYLLHLCRRRLAVPRRGSLTERILVDLGDWFAAQGGNGDIVHCADEVLQPDRSLGRSAHAALERFVELLGLFHNEGFLSFNPTRKTDKGTLLSHVDGGIFIPEQTFQKALNAKKAPAVDNAVVTTMLAETGVLVGEHTLEGSAGWIVREDWWENQRQAWQAGCRGDLRIVG